MRQESGPAETPPAVTLASSSVAGAARPDAAVSLPALQLRVPGAMSRPRLRLGPVAGRVALATQLVGTLLVVLFAVGGPSVLVPRSTYSFPGWESGPLSMVMPRLVDNPKAIGIGFSVVLATMFISYLVTMGVVRTLSGRLIIAIVIALHVVLLLSPPLQLNDVFNYVGYAHLGGLHRLNPYTHVIQQEAFDPVYRFASWDNLRSPYGPLFSALTYPLAFMALPVAYWTLKLTTVLLSLAFVALVWRCARQLGRDPRFAVVMVALNPIYIVYAVGGFHNDFFMLVPMLGAVSLLLSGRDRSAGAVLMLAVAVKFTAVIVLPFLLIAAATRPRRTRVVVGAALAAVPLVGLDVVMFGLSIPNLSQQSSLLTDFSIPNIVGLALGFGGGSAVVLDAAIVVVVVVVVHQIARNRDWLTGAGWSTVALVASLSWLMPWYVIWVLPLAALGTSVRLRRTAIVGTAFLILTFMPAAALYMSAHGIHPLGSAVGHASLSEQNKLEH